MLNWLMSWRIDSFAFLAVLYGTACVVALVLLVRRPASRVLIGVAAAVLGGLIALCVVWLIDDVFNMFGVSLTPITRMWIAFAGSGIALALVSIWRARWWRRVVAIIAIPLFVLVAAAGINVDFGAYRSVSQALGMTHYPMVAAAELHGHAEPPTAAPFARWRPPADMPAKGRVEEVIIPGTRSKFPAKPAVIYLPPAALVSKPPALPVIIAMAGQPGAPVDMMTSGRMNTTFDAYAAKHQGLAPIVVAPDQLGRKVANPMCIDSKLGDSATYLTQDVPNWIRSHLKVLDSPEYWALAGYSQGGTCSVQFATEYPTIFSKAVAVLSELRPTIGANTLSAVFDGSRARYDATAPVAIMARNAPYTHTSIVFGEGQNDLRYRAFGAKLQAAADRAGIRTRLIVSPGTAHDWNTVRYVFAHTLPALSDGWGLNR